MKRLLICCKFATEWQQLYLIAIEIVMVSNETVVDLLQIGNGITIELQQHILQRLIVIANLLHSCNGMVNRNCNG